MRLIISMRLIIAAVFLGMLLLLYDRYLAWCCKNVLPTIYILLQCKKILDRYTHQTLGAYTLEEKVVYQ